MVRFLSSTKLTVALCLLLAAGGVAGSLLYYGNTSFGRPSTFNIFRSPFFLVPGALLFLNILFCAGSRLASMSPRRSRTWTFAGIHLGLILLGGGLLTDGLFGFVGTQYFHLGVPSSSYFNWRTNRDETFPFTIEVTDSRVSFHPIHLQIGVKDREGNKVGLFTVREGVSFRAGDPPVTVTPRKFDVDARTLAFDAEAGGQVARSVAVAGEGSSPVGGYVVVPVAFADPEPSDFAVKARFALPNRAPEEKTIRVNDPASFGGFSFCLVAQNVDQYRNPIVGLQMTREPGAPLFWAGGLLFGLSLLVHLSGKRSPAGEVMGAGEAAPDAVPGFASGKTGKGAVLLLVVLGVLPGGPAASAAEVRGSVITGEETWEGEVRVTAPVSVEKGGLLRILPGTRVLLSGEDADGDGCREGYIQVFGRILVEGERSRPVLFTRLDPGKEWEELFLKDAEGSIRYAVFEGGAWGVHTHDGKVRIALSLFRGNGGGAWLRGEGAAFSRCTFRENGYGIRFWDGGPSVRASVFEGNGTGLFYREGAGGGTINGNRISGNETNLRVGDWAAGDLDAAGNWWGSGDANAFRIRDFREKGRAGRLVLLPALDSPPDPCGADVEITGSGR